MFSVTDIHPDPFLWLVTSLSMAFPELHSSQLLFAHTMTAGDKNLVPSAFCHTSAVRATLPYEPFYVAGTKNDEPSGVITKQGENITALHPTALASVQGTERRRQRQTSSGCATGAPAAWDQVPAGVRAGLCLRWPCMWISDLQ